ncbi:hypothetical protein [Sphingobacterium multivorum]|nr:hypothetical protein [Sphingobacterium multivorum]
MKILKDQVFNGIDQAMEAQPILQWDELQFFISGEVKDEESCPILTF